MNHSASVSSALGSFLTLSAVGPLSDAKNHPEYLDLARGVAQAASALLQESPASLPRMVSELEQLPR